MAGSAVIVTGIAIVATTVGTDGRSSSRPAPFASPQATAPGQPLPSPDRSWPPASGAQYPPPPAGVAGPGYYLALANGEWSFRDSRTGESSAAVHPTGYTVTSIAAGGDNRAYYVASTKGTCGDVRIHRVDVSGDDIHSTGNHDVPDAVGIRGRVVSMAISGDGIKLAYAVATKVDPDYPQECSDYQLRVLNLRTGATRTWTGADAIVSDLAWAADGHTLLFHAQECCGDYAPGVARLDTRSAGRFFTGAPVIPGTDDQAGGPSQGCVVSATAASATEVFAAQECYDIEQTRLVVIDPATGRVVRRVATVRGGGQVRSLSVSEDGRHVLLSGPGETAPRNFRIDDGTISQLSTHLDDIAW